MAVGIAGLSVSAASLLYAVYVTRKSRREKKLVHEVLPATSLADVVPKGSGHSLHVFYERTGQQPVPVEHATVSFLRFANMGRVPVVPSDIAAADPLAVEVVGGNLLSISLTRATRPAIELALDTPKSENGRVSALIKFAFLDEGDGGLIQVVADSEDVTLRLRGTVVGMPSGIIRVEPETERELSGWGCLPLVLLLFALLSVVPFVYRNVMQTWRGAWLLSLPLVAVLVGLAVGIAYFMLFEGRGPRYQFRDALAAPQWYEFRRNLYWHSPYARRLRTRNRDVPGPREHRPSPEGQQERPQDGA